MSKKIKRYLQLGLPVLILIALGIGIKKYVNGDDVVDALQRFDYRYAAPILLLSGLYLLIVAQRFVMLLRALTENVNWHVPFKSFIASQPGLLIPGGLALRASLLHQAGVGIGRGSVPVLLSSMLDQVAFFGISLVAALWYPPARIPVFILLALLALCGSALTVQRVRQSLDQLVMWVVNKFHVVEQWQQFKSDLPRTLRWQVLAPTLALTALSLAVTVLILHLSVLSVEQSAPYHALLLAFVLPTMLGRLVPILPGGFGVTEASMVGVLMSVAMMGTSNATAIVIMFRLATIFFQALLGAIVYFFLWRGQQEEVQLSTS